MILQDKILSGSSDPLITAGEKQESTVAFYLRRAFKNHPKIFVFHDYRFTHNGENAQIDHLVLYPFGFVLIESKSITGEVVVNEQQEWSRSYLGKWQGMPSPIKQVELQQHLLKAFLHHHRAEILPKLLKLKQQSFAFRCWDTLCAISSNAIIDRSHMPTHISNKLVKSEFIVDKLQSIMAMKNAVLRALNPFDTRPAFSERELQSVCNFLMEQSINNQSSPITVLDKAINTTFSAPIEMNSGRSTQISSGSMSPIMMTCKQCHSAVDLQPSWGRYGYYVKCGQCNTNTPMKQPCPQCHSKNTKVSKRGESYTLFCQDCDAAIPIE